MIMIIDRPELEPERASGSAAPVVLRGAWPEGVLVRVVRVATRGL